eukprot:16580-Heterococcus_DN1.PRE.1
MILSECLRAACPLYIGELLLSLFGLRQKVVASHALMQDFSRHGSNALTHRHMQQRNALKL